MPAARILSDRAIMSLAILLGFGGGAPLCLGLMLLLGGAGRHALTWELLVPGVLVYAAGRRRRVVWLDDAGVRITWGRRLPLTIARHAPDAWIALGIETVRRTELRTVGHGGAIPRALPDLYCLRGRTRDWQDVVIADCPDPIAAQALCDELASRAGLVRAPFTYQTRAERGARDWQEDPFFVANERAARLYLHLVDATPAGPIDVVARASMLRIRRPWAEIARLEEAGWLHSKELAPRPGSGEARAERVVAEQLSRGPASEASLLAALEATLGWADPDVLAYVLSRLSPPR